MLQVPRVYKVKRVILVREVLQAKMDKRENKAQLEYKGKRAQLVYKAALEPKARRAKREQLV